MKTPKIFINGPPQCGKTTFIQRILPLFPTARGYVTAEIRELGRRTGFAVQTLSGISGLLASERGRSGRYIGRFAVDIDAIDSLVVPELQGAIEKGRMVIADEIGTMELSSESFRQSLTMLLLKDIPFIGTINMKSCPFIKVHEIKADGSAACLFPETETHCGQFKIFTLLPWRSPDALAQTLYVRRSIESLFAHEA